MGRTGLGMAQQMETTLVAEENLLAVWGYLSGILSGAAWGRTMEFPPTESRWVLSTVRKSTALWDSVTRAEVAE